MTLPAPYPSDTRAKGWRFEIDHERIRQSDTWALAAPEQRPWLLMLWLVAWEQTPCGSLPNDDALIAARIGMPARQFAKCRDVLMRGWWIAEDGRLYHAVITLRVNEMLAKRAKDAKRAADNRERRAASHANNDGVTRDTPVTQNGVRPEFDTKHQAPVSEDKSSERAPARPSRPTRKCPSDFEVSPSMLAWAVHESPHVDAYTETEKFRDHTFKTAISDWPGAWRNWIRKAGEYAGARGQRPMSFREADSNAAAARVREMTGGLLDATKPKAEVIDVTPRLVG